MIVSFIEYEINKRTQKGGISLTPPTFLVFSIYVYRKPNTTLAHSSQSP